jgi:outer membrane protein assembly factor BamB
MKLDRSRYALALPLLAVVLAVAALLFWRARQGEDALAERLPGADQPPGADGAAAVNPILSGQLIPGQAQPANLPGLWPQFRGPNRDGISPETTALARSWEAAGPRPLWAVDCGEGYAGVAIREGRVYLMDYDRDKKQNALRCLSLADGGEIWRFAYTMPVKRNHGMTRTVPALADQYVVAMDPKCHVLCLDAATVRLAVARGRQRV